MDKHAPFVNKTYTIRPNTQWYNANIRHAKVVRRRYERAWIKSGQPEYHARYVKQTQFVNFLMKEAKTEFFSSQVLASSDDKKKLFNVAKHILNWKSDPVLPSTGSKESLPNDFNGYFVDKIVKIRDCLTLEIQKQKATDLLGEVSVDESVSKLEDFSPASCEEIHKIITSASSASCALDAIPTPLLKSCMDVVLQPITDIVNLSLKQACVPQEMKKAVVIPLIKKITLDKDNMKNYRPVSNLNFISKIVEKVVASRLNQHLEMHHLSEKMQSAYRMFHSTETALLKVKSDILKSMHNKQMVALVLLDLSAAFDTIDHGILFNRLEHRFGVVGNALEWFKSYLCNRSQKVMVSGYTSDQINLNFGVPQGSVLGPILFTLYMSPVGDIARRQTTNHPR